MSTNLKSHVLQHGLWAVLWLILLGIGIGSAQADQCRPTRNLAQDTGVQFLLSEQTLTPRLEATLAKDVRFSVPAARFRLTPGSPVAELKEAVLIADQELGQVIEGDLGTLSFDQESGTVSMRAGGRRFLVRVEDGKARDAHGKVLKLRPVVFRAVPLEVAPGAMVRIEGDSVVVARGARLVWTVGENQPLEAVLAEGARLDESANEPSAGAITTRPRSVVAGGQMEVTVDTGDLDLGERPPVLCFQTRLKPDGQSASLQVVAAREVQRTSQSGNKQTYSLRLPIPTDDDTSLSVGAKWWQRILGLDIDLRVLSYSGSNITLDRVVPLRLTSYRWTVAMSVGVMFLLYLVAATAARRANPFSIIAAMILHSSGRYSLSNLQILLWTLLVVFAYTFAWVSTGQLLELSNGVLALLGISAAGSVLARVVESKTPSALSPAAESPRPRDLVMDEEGENFELLRFQMLAFTLFSLLYSLVAVLRSEGLPDIPDTLIMLMGVSNTAYVAGKVPAAIADGGTKTDVAPGPNEYERGLKADDIRALQRRLGVVPASGQLDAPTRDAIVAFKREQGIHPASTQINERLFLRVKQVKGD